MQLARGGVVGVGEHGVGAQLGRPAVFPALYRPTRVREQRVDAARQLHVAHRRLHRGERVEVGGVAVEEAKVALVHRAHVVRHRAVVPPTRPGPLERGRKPHLLRYLRGHEAAICQTEGLVVEVAVHVTVAREVPQDPFFPPPRPMVLAEHRVALHAEQLDCLAQILGPAQGVSYERATGGEHVVHAVHGVLRDAQDSQLGEGEVHLRGRLAVRDELKGETYAVNLLFLAGSHHVVGGWDQRDLSRRGGLADARVHLPAGSTLQARREHVGGAAHHRPAREHVLGDRVLEEARRRPHGHATAAHVLLGDDPLHAPEMVDVGVGVDDRAHLPLPAAGAVERERRFRALPGDERVDHDHAPLPLHERHVGEVVPPHLVDRGRHLEQPVHPVQPRHPPQAGVHCVGRLVGSGAVGRTGRAVSLVGGDERVAVHVPHCPPFPVPQHETGRRGDQPAPCILEVLTVLERQLRHRGGM
jgi:hypothetical protein